MPTYINVCMYIYIYVAVADYLRVTGDAPRFGESGRFLPLLRAFPRAPAENLQNLPPELDARDEISV